MRKLIVSNFATLDGFYESKTRSIEPFFEYQHPDYRTDDAFDHYNVERMRGADTLLLGGRESYLGNLGYWTSLLENPAATPVRREFSTLIGSIQKVVVSDKLNTEELGVWSDTTRIVKVADSVREVKSLKGARAETSSSCSAASSGTIC